MRAFRDQERIVLQVSSNEVLLLRRILEKLRDHYEKPPDQSDEVSRRSWYATGGCGEIGMTQEEQADWVAQLHQIRRGRLPDIESTLESLTAQAGQADGARISWSMEIVPGVLGYLNDYRVMEAARHSLGEKEMSLGFLDLLHTLEPARQMALCEIAILAQIQEELLEQLPHSGSDWKDTLTEEDWKRLRDDSGGMEGEENDSEDKV